MLLSACGTSLHRAPVEDRNPQQAKPAAPLLPAAPAAPDAAASAPEVKLPPGAENAGKPGYYTVKPGDVLI
ncbi:peptidase, partial [Pelomonas sp. HMWF004]